MMRRDFINSLDVTAAKWPIVAIMSAMLSCGLAGAQAPDEAKYLDLKGAWLRTSRPNWVQPGDRPAPLTPEYQAIYDANLAVQARGGMGDAPQWYCLPQGMPMMMSAYSPMEFVVTPDVTYILTSHVNDAYRRVFTDGRGWPRDVEPTYVGYSIGRWIEAPGGGRYDVLEIETRHLKNPRTFDTTGLPVHRDAQTVIHERLHLDPADRNILRNDITVIDHALTEPWTVTKKYRRDPNPQPVWIPEICAEGNRFVRIGDSAYSVGPDGLLMPVTKDQPPPDLRHFAPARQ
jgi:hypothetical protein